MYSEGYTLWLIPKGEIGKRFSDLIKKLAKENNAPVFSPHITLLGSCTNDEKEAISKTQQLVSGQKPFTVKLGEIDYEDYHFRTLFIRAEKSEPLLALHNKAKEIFGNQDIPPYMPHLSLLYGIFPNELKEQIIKEIGRDQSAEFEVNQVTLVKGGEVAEWKIVGEFNFS